MRFRSAFFFCVPLVFATAAICGARASAAPCPAIGPISSHDGRLYVTRFIAPKPYVGAADAAFYTATNEYDAHIPALSVTTPGEPFGFRSETLSILNPATEPLEAVAVTFAQTDAPDRCIEHLHIGSGSKREDDSVKAAFAGLDPATAPIALLKVLGSGIAPSCPKPYVDARFDGQPVWPDYPDFALAAGEKGVVLVRTALNPDGSVASATIYKSSGFESLDRSALKAASSTHYLPQIFRCEPIGGEYLYNADFYGR